MGPLYWVNSTALFEGDVVHILPFGIGHDAVATGFRVFVSVASRLPVTEFGFSSALPGFSVSCFQSLPVKTISEAGGRSTDGTVALILVLLRFPARILSLSLSLSRFIFFFFVFVFSHCGVSRAFYKNVFSGDGRHGASGFAFVGCRAINFFSNFFSTFFPSSLFLFACSFLLFLFFSTLIDRCSVGTTLGVFFCTANAKDQATIKDRVVFSFVDLFPF